MTSAASRRVMQAEGDVIRFPAADPAPPDFAAFFAEEHAGLFRALYFVTGNRADAAELAQDWANDEFSPQMWDPFSEWVSANYPDDAEVMYAYCACSGASGFAIQNLTERSIRLWRLHVAEYVDHVTGN
jgi:hypothetical protein